MPEIVRCKLALESVRGFLPVRHRCNPSIQDENIDRPVVFLPLSRECADRSQESCIQQAERQVCIWVDSPDRDDRSISLLLISCGDDDASPSPCERESSLIADAAR